MVVHNMSPAQGRSEAPARVSKILKKKSLQKENHTESGDGVSECGEPCFCQLFGN